MKPFLKIAAAVLTAAVCLAGCAKPAPADPAAGPAAPSAPETQAPETEPAPLVEIDGTAVLLRDDGGVSPEDTAELTRTPVFTNSAIGFTAMSGPLRCTVQGFTVYEIIPKDVFSARQYGVEQGAASTLVSVTLSVENTGDGDVYFQSDRATLTTDTGVSVDADFYGSDNVSGEFFGSITKTGNIYFILPTAAAREIGGAHLHLRGARDGAAVNVIGEDIDIDFTLIRE